jgi:hypothetical protein
VITGLAVDPGSRSIFWAEEAAGKAFSAGLTGAATYEVNTTGAPVAQPWGLAYDPASGRLYWGNRGNGANPVGAIGFSNSGTDMGAITPTGSGSLVGSPQDPLVIKSPTNTGPPTISNEGRALTCSLGGWAPDAVSSSVYQAPRSFAYEWMFNDAPIGGANEASYMADTNGRYRCVVIATNAAGSTRASAAVSVTSTMRAATKTTPAKTPGKLTLTGKPRKLKAKRGEVLSLKVLAVNGGTSPAAPVKACLVPAKKAKPALKPGKCQTLTSVGGGATATAKLSLRVKKSAKRGLYKLQITLPGSPAQKVSVRVVG